MWARFITTDYVALLFFAVLYHVYGGDAQTDSPREECESKLKTYRILLYAVSAVGGVFFIVILVGIAREVKCLGFRKSPVESSDDPEQQIKDARHKHHKDLKQVPPGSSMQPVKKQGRISYYELRKLVQYAFDQSEEDKLEDAIKLLMNDNTYEIQRSEYGSTDDQYNVYRALCYWKKKGCENQIEQLFHKCSDVEMVESIQKLKDLRRCVWNVPTDSSFSDGLKTLLRLIGNNSTDNITNLLKTLDVQNVDFEHSSGQEEIVLKASEKLEKWKEEFIPISPVVTLFLALEDLMLNEGRDEHIRDAFWTL